MEKTCAVLLADGFETVEALGPLDCLDRSGARVTRVGCPGAVATSSNGVPVTCDATLAETDLSAFDLVVVPGGSVGVDNLRALDAVSCELRRRMGENGLLDGRTATCYPGCETDFPDGVRPDGNGVYRDGNLVTASGPGFALPFGLALVAALVGDDARDSVASAMLLG